MRHISVLLGFAMPLAAACDPSSTDGGAVGTTDTGVLDGTGDRPAATDNGLPGDGASETTGGTTTGDSTVGSGETDGGSSSSDGESSESTGADGGTDSDTGSGTDETSDGSLEGGSESGGDDMAGTCDPESCVTDCGYIVPDSDKGLGPCWSPVPEHEPWSCPIEAVCPNIDFTDPFDGFAGAGAACLLDALANDTIGRVDYGYYPDEYDNRWGTIFIVGDGTVLLDMYTGGHCGNGGSYGSHPILTRAMSIDYASAALMTCAGSDDPEELIACAFGSGFAVASSPDSLPWLVGECVATEPACP